MASAKGGADAGGPRQLRLPGGRDVSHRRRADLEGHPACHAQHPRSGKGRRLQAPGGDRGGLRLIVIGARGRMMRRPMGVCRSFPSPQTTRTGNIFDRSGDGEGGRGSSRRENPLPPQKQSGDPRATAGPRSRRPGLPASRDDGSDARCRRSGSRSRRPGSAGCRKRT